MSKPFYVKYEAPKEVIDAAYEALNIASKSGVVRKGTNEATKAVERAIAKLVVIAEDVEPPEVIAHLPLLCDERKIPYVFVPSKLEIGKAIGIDVPAASACILKEGEATGLIKEIISRLEQIKRGSQ
ncbi:MAG: 50S ribosomal protein L7Ae [Candidatus Bathyarchaeota archaeon]|nr:50S ribosomal protein L7Ae [Candidatus Bathyarchaeota archaeon]